MHGRREPRPRRNATRDNGSPRIPRQHERNPQIINHQVKQDFRNNLQRSNAIFHPAACAGGVSTCKPRNLQRRTTSSTNHSPGRRSPKMKATPLHRWAGNNTHLRSASLLWNKTPIGPHHHRIWISSFEIRKDGDGDGGLDVSLGTGWIDQSHRDVGRPYR